MIAYNNEETEKNNRCKETISFMFRNEIIYYKGKIVESVLQKVHLVIVL